MAHVLIVDDERPMRRVLARQLAQLHHTSDQAPGVEAALEAMATGRHDVVLTDVRMPGQDGLQLCERLHLDRPDVPVIVMTGYGTLDMAVAAIRAGAWDFLRKPFGTEALEVALSRALRHQAVHRELRQLKRVTRGERGPEGMVGASAPMQELFERIERAGPTQVSVLVLGPSGVGKERVARAIHALSPRAAGPFVAVNCAAIPETLVESELFGHEAGAFTGASHARQGVFRAAGGGTLFLDEVGELSLSAQTRLLRALELRVVRPVGRDDEIPVDVRVVAATNVDLAARVADRSFRADLYYRLKVLPLQVPPLTERGDDVLLLASDLLAAIEARTGRRLSLEDDVEDAILRWGWPGNVRELKNVLDAAAALSLDGHIRMAQLPDELRGIATAPAPTHVSTALPSLDEVERRHVLRVIRATEGNRSKAARILGIDRKTLLARLRRYGADG